MEWLIAPRAARRKRSRGLTGSAKVFCLLNLTQAYNFLCAVARIAGILLPNNSPLDIWIEPPTLSCCHLLIVSIKPCEGAY